MTKELYDYAVALRAVNTIDFMTAESAEIPFEVLQTVMSRIINEVRGVNRVFYDLTSKPLMERLSLNSKQSFINGVNKPFMGLFFIVIPI